MVGVTGTAVRRGWAPAGRAVLGVGGLWLAGQVFMHRVLPALGLSQAAFNDYRQDLSFAVLVVTFVGLAALAVVWYRWVAGRPLNGFGFRFPRSAWALSGVGLLVYLGCFAAGVAVSSLGGLDWTVAGYLSAAFLARAVLVYLAVGLWEEFWYRGYLFSVLKPYGRGPAYLLSVAAFALMHFTEPGDQFGILRVAGLISAAFLYTYTYDRTGSIWPGVIWHGAYDLLADLVFGGRYGVTLVNATGPGADLLGGWMNVLAHLPLVVWVYWRAAGRGVSRPGTPIPRSAE